MILSPFSVIEMMRVFCREWLWLAIQHWIRSLGLAFNDFAFFLLNTRTWFLLNTWTWFYLLRSSAITIAGSQVIAEACFHMIADDRRTFCDLRSVIVCDHMETSLKNQRVPRDGPADIRSLTSSLSENVTRCFGEMLRNSYGLYPYLKNIYYLLKE